LSPSDFAPTKLAVDLLSPHRVIRKITGISGRIIGMTDLESPMTDDTQPPAPRRNRRNVLVVSAVAVVVALVACLVGGEFYLRDKVKSCLSSQFQSAVGTPVSVGLGATPVLVDWLDKHVSQLTLDSQGGQFGPARGMKVHAVVRDIRLQSDDHRAGTVGSSEADVTWDSEGIADTLKQSLAGTVSGVKTNPSDGTIEVDGILNSTLTVKPAVRDGAVNMQAQNASILGFGLPDDLVDSVVKQLTSGLQQQYPLGMTVKSMQITDSGVSLTLTGGNYDLPKPPPNQQNTCT
jgi:hypothetical protein